MDHDQPAPGTGQDEEAAEQEIRELAESLDRDAKEAAPPPPDSAQRSSHFTRFLSSPWTALTLSLAALILTVLNILAIPPFGFRARSASPQTTERDLDTTLQFVKEEVRAFESENGRAPQSLDEINLDGEDGLALEPLSGGAVQVRVTLNGQTRSALIPPLAQQEPGGPR